MLLFFSIAGCRKQEPQQIEEVVFWAPHGPPASETLEKIVNNYNAGNPAVKVRFVQVPGSETDTTVLMTAVRGGIGPDVYMLDRFIVAQRASGGILEDLTDVIARVNPNFKNEVLEWAWNEVQFRGRTYGLPFDTDTRGLFYNIDMLKEAGIDPALLDRQRGPITIDLLWEIARRIDTRDAQGEYIKMGFIPQYSQGWHYTWGFVFGGEFADLHAGRVTPTHPGVVAGFQFLYDWNREMGVEQVQNFISGYMSANNPPENDPFITGNLAMMIAGDWQVNTMERYGPDVNWGVTYIPVPRAGDRPTTWAGGQSMVIPVNSNRSQARLEGAVRFMSYICGVDGQRLYFLENGNAPTLKALLDEQGLFPANKEYFRESLGFARSRPPLPVGALYWDALSAAQDLVVENLMTPLEALQQTENAVQPQLDRFRQ